MEPLGFHRLIIYDRLEIVSMDVIELWMDHITEDLLLSKVFQVEMEKLYNYIVSFIISWKQELEKLLY
jgi:hypothetical protein